MAIFEIKGFIRKQEIAFARKLLVWKYEKSGTAVPDDAILSMQVQKIVDDAHNIAKKSGSNVLDILKDRVNDIINKKKR